ncbi:MAG: nucleotide exchange factor GrpE [Candidatus Methanomethylophilaceae archaeon]|nr:nucleotide exchange factor GrpE [Candidatus Methanomethylophilaceae archaeon]
MNKEDSDLVKFLRYGRRISPAPQADVREDDDADVPEEDFQEPDETYPEGVSNEEVLERIGSMEGELSQIRELIEGLAAKVSEPPDMSKYVTSKEQMKTIISTLDKRDSETIDKRFVRAMEQIAVMREDFSKLCAQMREKVDSMPASQVFSSFETYCVDMENILSDAGVTIGSFPIQKVDSTHHRIVDVVPTGDEEKNGLVAASHSDGYKLGKRVLLKERVSVYKYVEGAPSEKAAEETDSETTSETDSETTCETSSETVSSASGEAQDEAVHVAKEEKE